MNRLSMTLINVDVNFKCSRMQELRRRMDFDGHSRIRFADFEADLSSHELFRHGIRITLQEKPFLVLSALLQSPHKVITRKQLGSEVWPDSHVEIGFCLNTAVRKLRRALNDSAAQPRFIETVGKIGYRFIGRTGAPEELRNRAPARMSTPNSQLVRPTRLVVLPFEDLGLSPDAFFAKGMTLHVITRLAHRHKHLAVIVFPRKQSGRGIHQICQELRADYALAGSVLRSAGLIRVDVELVEGTNQSCIWAETYLRHESEPIIVQDDLARRIISSVLQIVRQNAQSTSNVEAKTA